jgi:hypothetical protein
MKQRPQYCAFVSIKMCRIKNPYLAEREREWQIVIFIYDIIKMNLSL